MTNGKNLHSGPILRLFAARRVTVAGLLTLAIGIGAEAAVAQGHESRSGYTGFFAAGVSAIAIGEMDDRLAASGYPDFGSKPRGIALGVYRLLGNGVMLGGEWHYMSVGDGEHQGREVGLGGGYATLGVGYARQLSPRVRVYPRLGLGAAGMGLWIEEEDAGEGAALEFDEALADPRADPNYSVLSQGSMAVDLGAGAELLLGNRGGGPLAGLRLGYVATPFDQGWTRDGRSLSGAPDATVAGPYLRLLIGWRLR